MSEVTESDVEGYGSWKSGEMPEGLIYNGATLVLESETLVRMYYTVETGHDINEYTFHDRRGKTLIPVNHAGNTYYVDVENVAAKDIPGYTSVRVTDGNKELTMNYSVNTYVRNKLKRDGEDEVLQDLSRALYLYGKAAEEYFANPTGN